MNQKVKMSSLQGFNDRLTKSATQGGGLPGRLVCYFLLQLMQFVIKNKKFYY